jgi:hypothetical protein
MINSQFKDYSLKRWSYASSNIKYQISKIKYQNGNVKFKVIDRDLKIRNPKSEILNKSQILNLNVPN